jgi:hypothetical protein
MAKSNSFSGVSIEVWLRNLSLEIAKITALSLVSICLENAYYPRIEKLLPNIKKSGTNSKFSPPI